MAAMTVATWNAANPRNPRGPDGRFIRSGLSFAPRVPSPSPAPAPTPSPGPAPGGRGPQRPRLGVPELADRVRAAGSDQEARDALRGATNEQLRGVARELDIRGRSRARRKAEIQDVIVQGRSPQRRGDADTTTPRGRLGVPDLSERERRRQELERAEQARREREERERQELERQRREQVEQKVRPDVRGQVRQVVVSELDRQSGLTPEAFRKLSRVDAEFDHSHQRALAYFDLNFQQMHLHPDWARPDSPMWEAGRKSRESGWWTPSGADNALGVVVAHEYGHHITSAMFQGVTPEEARRLLETIRDQLGIPMDTEPPDLLGMASVVRRITDAVENHPRVVLSVSAYAATNGHELLAEVWQEYSTMGDRARPHIRAIGNVMQEMAEGAT